MKEEGVEEDLEVHLEVHTEVHLEVHTEGLLIMGMEQPVLIRVKEREEKKDRDSS